MSLGSYCLIKNEAAWVGYSVMAAKDIISEFVYFDGNSTDGTIEILEYLRDKKGINIRLFKDKDPKDLQDDYVRMFNECIKQCQSKHLIFLHPDMIVTGHKGPLVGDNLAYTTDMASLAGDPGCSLYRFAGGRGNWWKNIAKNAFGLHYFGHYGAWNEDTYFRDITGDAHTLYEDYKSYPYEVGKSGISINHYSDVRPYSRRYGRMVTCLKNQFPLMPDLNHYEYAKVHPRVSLASHKIYPEFRFEEEKTIPPVFTQHCEEFADLLGKKVEEVCYLPMGEKVHA